MWEGGMWVERDMIDVFVIRRKSFNGALVLFCAVRLVKIWIKILKICLRLI